MIRCARSRVAEACEEKWYQLDRQQRGVEPVWTQSGGADTAKRAGTTGVSRAETQVAPTAGPAGAPPANQTRKGGERGAAAGGEPFLAALAGQYGLGREHKQTTSTNKRRHSLVSYPGDMSNQFGCLLTLSWVGRRCRAASGRLARKPRRTGRSALPVKVSPLRRKHRVKRNPIGFDICVCACHPAVRVLKSVGW